MRSLISVTEFPPVIKVWEAAWVTALNMASSSGYRKPWLFRSATA